MNLTWTNYRIKTFAVALALLLSAFVISSCKSDETFSAASVETNSASDSTKNENSGNDSTENDEDDVEDDDSETHWANGNFTEFSDLFVRFEVNDTDGDIGIQVFFDAEGWNKVSVRDPNNRQIIETKSRGALRNLGLTEGFFESEEPSFDELSLAEFLEMFPEGIYRFYGKTPDGQKLYGESELTHEIPEAPVIVAPLPPSAGACTEDVAIPAQIIWMDPNLEIAVTRFEVIVEREEPSLLVFSIQLPSDAMMVTVPSEFLEPDVEYKFEIIAEEESGNRTITESCFITAE